MSAVVTKQATVTLIPLNFPADSSPRVLKLTPSASVVRIGRASKSASKNLHPGPNNAWFDSPVMSREHAQLSIVQNPKAISLMDIGSMHGTKIDNKQLGKQEVHKITSDQIVTFGSEVARGKGWCTSHAFPILSGCIGVKWSPHAPDRGFDKFNTNDLAPPDTFPPREFRVQVDWDDWSPPTPISSSPITGSPNRGYGITDEELMISSDDGMSDSRSSADKRSLNPAQIPTSPQPQTTAPVTSVSTFMVPDSEPSSPLTSDYDHHEGSTTHSQADKVSDSQEIEQAARPCTTISCQAELVSIEYSGPVGLTEQEKIEDEGLFLTSNRTERELNLTSTAVRTSSSSKRDYTIIDLDEETGNAKNPVIIEDTPALELDGIDKHNDTEHASHNRLDYATPGQELRGDEEYSPPPASAYGNESSVDSDYDVDVPEYSSGSGESGSEGNYDDDMVSEDEFDNEGWSRPVSDREESMFDYYDEPSEAEDIGSGDDIDEALPQPGLEPSKLSVMTDAMKTLGESPMEEFKNLTSPPMAPAVLVEDSQVGAANISGPSSRVFAHHNIQYRSTNCSLPPIQKMKVSEAVSPIYFPHDINPSARAPSPSDAAMVKTSSALVNPNIGSFPKESFGEFLSRNRVISSKVHEAIDKGTHPTDDVSTSESLRADNARKLGELSGKSEFFQAREANRKEAFLSEPKKPTVPQPTGITASFPSDADFAFSFEPGAFDFESQDTSPQKLVREFKDFASTASEAGSFGATDEFSSPPYMTDGARQGEFRDAAFPNATSAAGLKKDFENWKRDMGVSNQREAETAKLPRGMRENLGGPQENQETISSSRVSIRNIVDPIEEAPQLNSEMPGHNISSYVGVKRKADDISSLDLDCAPNLEPSQGESQPLASDDYLMADAQPRDQDALVPPELLDSFDSSSQFGSTQVTHEDEPTSKRVKVAGEPERGGIARFAAAALAGAVIGGMGVFAALVASAPSV